MSECKRCRWIAWWTRLVRGKPDTSKVHGFPFDPADSMALVALCGVPVHPRSRYRLAGREAGMVEFWGPESSANEKCQRCMKAWRQEEKA